MSTAILEVLTRCIPFAVGWFLVGALLAWRTRREPLPSVDRRGASGPYRVPAAREERLFTAAELDAAVAAERARCIATCAEEGFAALLRGEKRVEGGAA